MEGGDARGRGGAGEERLDRPCSEPSKAVKWSSALGELDPRQEKSLLKLAECYQIQGLYKEARSTIERAIAIHEKRDVLILPSKQSLYLDYGRLLGLMKDKEGRAFLSSIPLGPGPWLCWTQGSSGP
jgi:hypothetical protein